MRRVVAAALILFVVSAPLAGARAAETAVHAGDDYFDPGVVRVQVGATITWDNAGRSAHTVTADDGAFDSGNLDPKAKYTQTFSTPGVIRFFCRYHGARGGIGMSGVILVGNVPLPGASSGVGPGRETPPSMPGRTIRVPADQPTIQRAVDRARPGDLILVSPGTYPEAVIVVTPFLTIRGTDRNAVILDGGFTKPNGIHVIEADGVAVESMTARHYLLNGFQWTNVNGYRGSYLTAYDDGDYGIFAIGSVWGQFDHSYASGHPDSGIYIGQCHPCHAVISDVLSEDNGLGYSGTNAGGDLLIANSEWRRNMAGIVPNTLDSELMPPQRDVEIAGNYVHDNYNRGAPAKVLQYPALGIGILLAGGRGDVVHDNLVEDSQAFGIAIVPS
ncbi:MAG: cupredoxin domain-containing protein, partial [Actinomycetota bacterium]